MAKKQSTSFAQVATNLLNVLQGYSKTIRLLLVMFLTLTVSANAWGETWKKVTSAPSDWSGEYLIVYEDGNVAFNGSLTTLDAVSNTVSVTISDGTITTDANASFTIAKSSSNYTIKSASGYYIGQTSNANGLTSHKTTSYANTISINDDGTVNLVSGGAYLRYNAANNQTRFRYYKSSSYTGQKAICLYKKTESGSNESTQLSAPTNLSASAITTTTATLSWNEISNASSYNVTINNNTQNVTATTFSATGLSANTEYTWSVVAVGDGTTYSNSTAASHTFTTEEEQSSGDAGSGECTWELVTDASTLKADDEVIITASGENAYALSTNQKSNNRGATAITKNGNTLTSPSADVQILALKAGSTSGTWAFYTGTSGYLYAASSSGNQLKTKTTLDEHGSWTISITDGVASIAAKGSSNHNVMQYNYNNGSPLFACYASASQTSLAIYKKVCTTEPRRSLTY